MHHSNFEHEKGKVVFSNVGNIIAMFAAPKARKHMRQMAKKHRDAFASVSAKHAMQYTSGICIPRLSHKVARMSHRYS